MQKERKRGGMDMKERRFHPGLLTLVLLALCFAMAAAASAAEKVCDFVGLERFRFEPLLDEPEVEVDPRSVQVPALEHASVPSLIHVPGMEMA